MFEAIFTPQVQSYIVAAIVFGMVFCPLWRFAKSICNSIDRVNARQVGATELRNSMQYRNRLGED